MSMEPTAAKYAYFTRDFLNKYDPQNTALTVQLPNVVTEACNHSIPDDIEKLCFALSELPNLI